MVYMKKITLSVAAVLTGVFALAPFALAHDALPEPGTLPDSRWYVFERLAERLRDLFVFGSKHKAERALERAQERLSEFGALADKDNTADLNGALEDYHDKISDALGHGQDALADGQDVGELLKTIGSLTLQDQDLILSVLEKLPADQRDAILTALKESVSEHHEALRSLPKDEQDKLSRHLEDDQKMIDEELNKLDQTEREDIQQVEADETENDANDEQLDENDQELQDIQQQSDTDINELDAETGQ